MDKVCCRCNIKKDIDSFNNDKNKIDGKSKYCRSCKSIADKNYYNQPKIIKLSKDKNKIWVEKRKDSIKYYKEKCGGVCKKCNENRLHILDFHHIDPLIKDNNISYLVSSYGINNIRIEEEITKCILLCSNCHRDFHHLERENKTTIYEYLKL